MINCNTTRIECISARSHMQPGSSIDVCECQSQGRRHAIKRTLLRSSALERLDVVEDPFHMRVVFQSLNPTRTLTYSFIRVSKIARVPCTIT
jgi:hypothetical protein